MLCPLRGWLITGHCNEVFGPDQRLGVDPSSMASIAQSEAIMDRAG